MAEFAQNYGALIIASFSLLVSLGTFWAVWRGVNEWKKQKRVDAAERYYDFLAENMEVNLPRIIDSFIKDIEDEKHIASEDSNYCKLKYDIIKQEKQMSLIENIFPKIKKFVEKDHAASYSLGVKIEDISFEFFNSNDMSNERKKLFTEKISMLFRDSEELQQIQENYEKMLSYLADYIAKNLK